VSGEASLLVRGGWVLTGDPTRGTVLRDAAVLVENGQITRVGTYAELTSLGAGATVVGDERHLVLPGLVNAHHHARGATWLQRGHPDEPLEAWLLAFRFASPLDAELDARFAAERLLRAGITTVLVSFYAPPDAQLETGLRATLAGLTSTGIRVAFAVGVMDQSAWADPRFRESLPPDTEARLTERIGPAGRSPRPELALDLFRRLHAEPPDRATILLGPVSPVWCSEDLLQAVARLSADTGAMMHTHARETRQQLQPPLSRLAEIGFLSERVSLAHCVWLDDEDVHALATAGATVVHNPSSNLRLGSGIAPLRRLKEAGVTLALGTDSMGMRDDDDMLAEIGLAATLHRPSGVWLDPAEVVRMATVGGARAAGLANSVGQIAPGFRADLTLVDLNALANPAGVEAPLDLLVARATARHVDIVIVDGTVVVAGGRATLTDQDETARKLGEALRHTEPDPLADALMAEVRPFVRHDHQP
jgi:5-methylthioadenosine/S-adenosylhomocysteine deaminase